MSKIGPNLTPPPTQTNNFNIDTATTAVPMGLPQGFGEMPQTQAMDSLAELNNILEFAGLGRLTSADTVSGVQVGNAHNAPDAGGEVRERATPVKDFFKKVGSGLKSFFSAVGNTIANAAGKVKDFFAARFARAEPPIITAEQKQSLRSDALKAFAEQLESAYESLPQDPPVSREEFVARMMPTPEGGVDALNTESPLYFGDNFAEVRENTTPPHGEGKQAMFEAMMDRFEELPSLEVGLKAMMDKETGVLENNPGSFLRGNTAYSKTEKLFTRSLVPLEQMSTNLMNTQVATIKSHDHLGEVDGMRLGMTTINQEQADAVFGIANNILDALLDTNPGNEGSYLNLMPQEFKDYLSGQADALLTNPDIPEEEKQGAVEKLYANALFLRAGSGDLVTASTRVTDPGSGAQIVAVKSMQVVQTFLNGITDYTDKGNDLAQAGLDQLWETHGDRVTAFLHAAGMPEFD